MLSQFITDHDDQHGVFIWSYICMYVDVRQHYLYKIFFEELENTKAFFQLTKL
jgi:hypothetical protein